MASNTSELAFDNKYASCAHTTTSLRFKPLVRKAAFSITTAAAVISLANVQPNTASIFVPKNFLGASTNSTWKLIRSDKDNFLEKFPVIKSTLPIIYSTIHEVFGEAAVSTSVYRDIEENWENLLIAVDYGNVSFGDIRNAKKHLFDSFLSKGIDASVLKHITFSIG